MLIVGLGNPGKEYQNTRHNFGFMVLDAWAKKQGASFSDTKKFKSQIAEIKNGADRLVCVKPQTFMNLSGEAVRLVADFYKIGVGEIFAIYDDLDLPLGKTRITRNGSAGGHNGIKSLISCLGTPDFARLKLGIGRPKHAAQSAADYVLQSFTKEEISLRDEIIAKAVETLDVVIQDGLQEAMNRYN